jgi:magnesium transporter
VTQSPDPDSDNSPLLGALLAPEIEELLTAGETHEARKIITGMLDPEIADVMRAVEPRHRAVLFRLLPTARAADVFAYLDQPAQEQLLGELQADHLAQLMDEMAPDDRAELFEELPGQVAARLLSLMTPSERKRTQTILGYPPQSIGRIMTPDYLTVRPEWTAAEALDYIRKHGRDAESLDTLYVVDAAGKLLDGVRLRRLLLTDPSTIIDSLMSQHVVKLYAHADREEAVQIMERYDRPVLPVVNRGDVLVGIVTFDDVADVAEKETTEDIQKMGGIEALDEPYMAVSVWELFRKRGTWLSLLFLGELFTASAMGHFEHEIEKAVVLSLFLPLIISSGGNSGSQASTLVIRAMAVGEVKLADWWRVFGRELLCGLMLGVLLGIIGLARIHVWQYFGWIDYSTVHFSAGRVATTVGVSLIGVVMWGSLSGSMLPFLLRKLRLDPATISAPLVATLVDVTGLIIYFTTATVIMGL